MGMNDLHERCTDCQITRWEEDPFCLGSYSSFVLGTMERHVDALERAEWNGRLVFAGEATNSAYLGSVHGALISGRNASKSVLEHIS
jgi:monoamine oxidase